MIIPWVQVLTETAGKQKGFASKFPVGRLLQNDPIFSHLVHNCFYASFLNVAACAGSHPELRYLDKKFTLFLFFFNLYLRLARPVAILAGIIHASTQFSHHDNEMQNSATGRCHVILGQNLAISSTKSAIECGKVVNQKASAFRSSSNADRYCQ